MQIYCDMDGVLADFDLAYERVMGRKLPPRSERTEEIDWAALRARAPRFFRELPLMPSARRLWRVIEPLGACVLTGIPPEVPVSGNDKVAWGVEMLGVEPSRIVCCPARDKYLHCRPGDLLIDDWERYRDRWEAAGGLWITHVDVPTTIAALRDELGIIERVPIQPSVPAAHLTRHRVGTR